MFGQGDINHMLDHRAGIGHDIAPVIRRIEHDLIRVAPFRHDRHPDIGVEPRFLADHAAPVKRHHLRAIQMSRATSTPRNTARLPAASGSSASTMRGARRLRLLN